MHQCVPKASGPGSSLLAPALWGFVDIDETPAEAPKQRITSHKCCDAKDVKGVECHSHENKMRKIKMTHFLQNPYVSFTVMYLM